MIDWSRKLWVTAKLSGVMPAMAFAKVGCSETGPATLNEWLQAIGTSLAVWVAFFALGMLVWWPKKKDEPDRETIRQE